MNRSTLVVVLAILAAAIAAFFLLGGSDALFGTGGSRSGSSVAPPDEAAGPGAGREGDGSSASASSRRPVLFGRKRADLRGVGGLRVRVLHYGDNVPVQGARASLSGTGYGGEAVDVVATTDASGRAGFDGVAAGDGYRWSVVAEREGTYVLPDVQVKSRSTADLGTIYLGVHGDLEGRVVDEKGEGVAGADVRVYAGVASLAQMMENMAELFATLDREPKPLAKSTSGRDGRFKIEGVPPGSVTVRATAEGRVKKTVQSEMTPQGAAGGPVTIVLVAGVEVRGHVVDDRGRGVEGARLAVMSENSNDPFEFLYGRVFAETDASGAFRLTVERGDKRLRALVAAEGFPTSSSQRFEAGDTDVKIVLKGGATALVVVKEKESGRPIEGAQIMLVAGDSSNPTDQNEGSMVSGSTGADGTVTLLLRPGHIQFGMVSAPGHAGGMLSPMTEGQDGPPGINVEGTYPKEVKAGVENRFDFRLSKGIVLVGKVLDAKGNPIADAEVKPVVFFGGGGAAVRSAADGAYRLEGVAATMMGIVRVRASGWTQRMKDMSLNLPPDTVGEVTHDFTLYPSATVRGRVIDAESNPVAGAKVAFRPAGGMAGIATILGDVSAITASDGAYVLYDVDQNTASGADMMMAVAPDDPPGGAAKEPPKSTVRVTAAGYVEGRSDPFEVPEGATVDAPLVKLTHGARLSGTVTSPRGGPVPHARVEVSVRRADEKPGEFDFTSLMSGVKTVVAGEDGTFSVDTVAAGTATLTVFAEGYAATRKTVKVEGDASPSPFEIRMRQAVEAKGRVLGPDGRGIAGVRVSAGTAGRFSGLAGPTEPDDAYFEPVSAKTDADGLFVLKPLPPRRIQVSTYAEGYSPGSAEVEAGGDSVDIPLAKFSAESAKRIAEIDAEILKISQQFASVKDASERQALSQHLMDLMTEKKSLQAASPQPPGGMSPANR